MSELTPRLLGKLAELRLAAGGYEAAYERNSVLGFCETFSDALDWWVCWNADPKGRRTGAWLKTWHTRDWDHLCRLYKQASEQQDTYDHT